MISDTLRKRLGPGIENLKTITPKAESILQQFLDRLSGIERLLLSRRKRRALDELEIVLEAFLRSAASRKSQYEIDALTELLRVLKQPITGIQPDWEEAAARWLDLIRPIWYQKLQDKSRYKPLLLKHIRNDLIAAEKDLLPKLLREFTKEFPAQRSPDERIVACIIGVA